MSCLNKLISIVLLCVLAQACDEPDEQKELPDPGVNYDVIILNEGNFRSANASVDLYSSSSNQRISKVFQNTNGSRPLGDVAQSMIQYNDKYYIVVNNSSKIEVLNASDFKSIGQIKGMNSPRYILPIGNGMAYVSDLYEDKLYKVDLENFVVIGQLEYSGWIEEMVKVKQYAFLCNRDSNQVMVLDIQKDSLIKKIKTNANPNSIVLDKNQDIWVSCSGNNISKTALHQIDADSLNIIRTISSDDFSEHITELEVNATKDRLYYLNNGVFEISIMDTVLAASPLIPQNDKLFYAIGVHPTSNEIYVCDAIDYVQSGIVFRYSTTGQEIANFRTGIIPGFFFFR